MVLSLRHAYEKECRGEGLKDDSNEERNID